MRMISGEDIPDYEYVDPSDYYTTNPGVVLYELRLNNDIVADSLKKTFKEFMASDCVENFTDPRCDTGRNYVFARAGENNLKFFVWRRPNEPLLDYSCDDCYWGYIKIEDVDILVYGSLNFDCGLLDNNHVSNPKLFPFYIDPYVNLNTFDIDIDKAIMNFTMDDGNIVYKIYIDN